MKQIYHIIWNHQFSMLTPFWLHPHLLFWDLNKNDLSTPQALRSTRQLRKPCHVDSIGILKFQDQIPLAAASRPKPKRKWTIFQPKSGHFGATLPLRESVLYSVQSMLVWGLFWRIPNYVPSTQKHSNQASWLPSFQVDWFTQPLDMQWQKTIVITWWYKTVLQNNNMQLPVNKHTHIIDILRYTPEN